MSLKELQAKAVALGLRTYGKKDDIIKWINIFEAKKLKTTYVVPVQNVDQANCQAEVDIIDVGEDFEIVDVAINLEDDIANILKNNGLIRIVGGMRDFIMEIFRQRIMVLKFIIML